MKNRIAAPMAVALYFSLALFAGCAGGCGDDGSKSAGPDTGGASGGLEAPKSGGSGAALDKSKPEQSKFDTAKKGDKDAGAKDQLGGVSNQLSDQLAAGMVQTVTPENFKTNVLAPGTTVFVTVIRPMCADCQTVAPVMKTLAQQFSGKYDFKQVDGPSLFNAGLLPKGLMLEPMPGFAMYKDGKITSYLQGMPLERQSDAHGGIEPTEDYQQRLMRWFQDALTRKDLNFSKTLQKAPAPKN
jgi:hypothetical protein